MAKRVILEMGTGNDLHGGDYTKAALRAVQDALHHSSLSLIRSFGLDSRRMQVEVTIGVQQPDKVDAAAVKASLPHGEVTVKVVKGGLDVPDETSSDVAVIAIAAVAVRLDLPQADAQRSATMGESPMATYEYTTQDVEYLRHGDRKFMARLFKPQGKGPFPAIIEVHGGAWCNGDLNECQIYAEGFARAGLAVAAIDFRHAERRLSDVACRHQLCDPLGEGACVGTEHARRPGRHRRAVERRASRHAGGDAAERSALCGDPVAVIGTRGGCDGARGGDAVAGDQPAVALSPCVEGARFGQSAGLGRQHSAAA